MTAQHYRGQNNRQRLPTFTGRRLNPRGRWGPGNPGVFGVANRFVDSTKAPNNANRANPILAVSEWMKGTEVLCTVVAGDDAYRVVYDHAINPGDPTVFQRASAVALQYQNFSVHSLALRYVPAVATALSGSIYMAVVPSVDTHQPVNVDDFINLGGSINDQVFGKTFSLNVTPNMMNTAYNKLNIHKPVSGETAEDINSACKLMIAISGVDVSASTVIGQVYLDYNILLMNPTCRAPSNSFDGHFVGMTSVAEVQFPMPDETQIDRGHFPFQEADTPDVYTVRMKNMPMVLMIKAHTTTDSTGIEVRATRFEADCLASAPLTPTWEYNTFGGGLGFYMYSVIIPSGSNYFNIQWAGNAATVTGSFMYAATVSRS